MAIYTATEFKAKCLQILDQVGATGERVQITKRGRVVAEVVPPSEDAGKHAEPGFAKGKLRILGDILEPIDLEWEAQR